MKRGKRTVCVLLSIALIISVLCVNMSFGSSAFTECEGTVNSVTSLNVRVAPGTGSARCGSLNPGDKVRVLSEKNDSDGDKWYYITHGDSIKGYVYSTYITLSDIPNDTDFEKYLTAAGFPESYKPALRILHAEYPNWIFKADKPGINWEDALAAESRLAVNLVAGTSPDSWKSMDAGAYNPSTGKWVEFDTGGWVAASSGIVAYYMDPRNFLDKSGVFQFLSQEYDAQYQNKAGLSKIINGKFLDAEFPENTYDTYSDVIMAAAKSSSVSPYVLTSMILTEQGNKGTGNCISGKVAGYEGYYNYYNIGAYASGSMTAVQRGLWYAKGGDVGATSYMRPWNTRAKAIIGGAQWYADGYISVGQNTIYYKKFNVKVKPYYIHQYMSNVQAAYTEGSKLSSGYSELKDAALVFSIPVYGNMPEQTAKKPSDTGNNDNYLTSLTVSGCEKIPFEKYVYSYETIVENSVKSVTVSATPSDKKAAVSGTGTVSLKEGSNKITVTVTSSSGDKREYTVNIFRKESETPATPDEKVTVTSKKYTLSAYITGIEELTSVEEFLNAITVTGGSAEITALAGGRKTSGNVGTGDTLCILDKSGRVVETYTVAIRGDTNGDGEVTLIDLALVKKYLMGLSEVPENLFRGYDADGNSEIGLIDLALVKRELMGLGNIEQRG